MRAENTKRKENLRPEGQGKKKIEMQLTERDKSLLVFLALFVILVGFGYWGIRPSVQGIIKDRALLEKEKQQQELDDGKLAGLGMLEAENAELEAKIAEARSRYYPMMTSNEIDKMLTGMVLGRGLLAYDLEIAMPQGEAKPKAYRYSAKAQEDAAKEEETPDGGDWEEGLAPYGGDVAGLYQARVRMRLGGGEEELQDLISQLSMETPKLHLVSYSWEQSRGAYDEEEEEMENFKNLTICLDLYMYGEQ